MRSVSVRLADLQKVTIPIGFVGENEFTRVIIDCKTIFTEHPNAVVGMVVAPPMGDPYPAVVTRDGDFVIWDVTASDLIYHGRGEFQLSFTVDEMIGKTYKARINVLESILPSGEIPEPLENFLEEASEALTAIPQTIDDALQDAKDSGEFDGFSPIATVTKEGKVATITITDKNGTTSKEIKDGEDGQPGQPGSAGFSPSASVSKSGKIATITITDKNGTTTAQVSDGEDGTDVIDDTTTSLDKTWSSNKIDDKVETLKNALQGKYTKPDTGIPSTDLSSGVQTSLGLADSAYQKPSGGIPASDLASGVIPSVPVTDVQIDDTTIVGTGGVASIPYGSTTQAGVFKIAGGTYGIGLIAGQILYLASATDADIKTATNGYRPITPASQHKSVFYALAKCAGDTTQASSSNPVGTFTNDAKKAIRKMLGIPNQTWELIGEYTVTENTAQFDITTDSNGQPFALSRMVARCWLEPATTSANDYVASRILIKKVDGNDLYVNAPTLRYQTGGAKTFMEYETELFTEFLSTYGTMSSADGNSGSVYNSSSYDSLKIKYIRGFRLAQNSGTATLIPKDTVIKIYGVRIDE